MKTLFIILISLSTHINLYSQQCGNTTVAISEAWDFYEKNVPSVNKVIAISKLLDDIVALYNNFPNNGPGRAGFRGLNIPTHQPQTGTTLGIGNRVWITPPSQEPHVEITITKKGGKAKTHIDICITNEHLIQEHVKSYTFEKDAPNHSKTFVLKKVKGQIIAIQINPRFGTNIFEYEISVSSSQPFITETEEKDAHPSGIVNSEPAISKAGDGGPGIVRTFPTTPSAHPSGIVNGEPAVSKAGSGGSGIIRTSPPINTTANEETHPDNITRGPEEEIGGRYFLKAYNENGDQIASGTAIINPDEDPWLITIFPDNEELGNIKIRGRYVDYGFKGYLEAYPNSKVSLKHKHNRNLFEGNITGLLPNATFKNCRVQMIKN